MHSSVDDVWDPVPAPPSTFAPAPPHWMSPRCGVGALPPWRPPHASAVPWSHVAALPSIVAVTSCKSGNAGMQAAWRRLREAVCAAAQTVAEAGRVSAGLVYRPPEPGLLRDECHLLQRAAAQLWVEAQGDAVARRGWSFACLWADAVEDRYAADVGYVPDAREAWLAALECRVKALDAVRGALAAAPACVEAAPSPFLPTMARGVEWWMSCAPPASAEGRSRMHAAAALAASLRCDAVDAPGDSQVSVEMLRRVPPAAVDVADASVRVRWDPDSLEAVAWGVLRMPEECLAQAEREAGVNRLGGALPTSVKLPAFRAGLPSVAALTRCAKQLVFGGRAQWDAFLGTRGGLAVHAALRGEAPAVGVNPLALGWALWEERHDIPCLTLAAAAATVSLADALVPADLASCFAFAAAIALGAHVMEEGTAHAIVAVATAEAVARRCHFSRWWAAAGGEGPLEGHKAYVSAAALHAPAMVTAMSPESPATDSNRQSAAVAITPTSAARCPVDATLAMASSLASPHSEPPRQNSIPPSAVQGPSAPSGSPDVVPWQPSPDEDEDMGT